MSTDNPASDPVEVVALPDLDQLREDWRPLAEASGNPFVSWEWASTWWRHFGRDREQKMLGCKDAEGRLIAIAPLYYDSRRPIRVLRFVGHFPADQLEPVCAAEHAEPVLRLLGDHLGQSSSWDLTLWERSPLAIPVDGPGSGHRIRSEAMPELHIEAEDWDGFLASKSSNFRGQVRNYERRLVRDHGLEIRLSEDPDRLDEDMETLFDLHRRAWKAKGLDGAFPTELASFHRDFAHLALERGWLRLWIASLDGEPAAAWYGFRIDRTDWFYQGGRDPGRGRDSVGFVLMAHTVRDAVENGTRTYKLLLGAEEYKKRFSNHVPTVETVAVTRTVRGRLAVSAALTQNRIRERFARGSDD